MLPAGMHGQRAENPEVANIIRGAQKDAQKKKQENQGK